MLLGGLELEKGVWMNALVFGCACRKKGAVLGFTEQLYEGNGSGRHFTAPPLLWLWLVPMLSQQWRCQRVLG